MKTIENNNEYIINRLDIESNENIKIRNKEIFIGDLLSKSKIISYESLIVLGDIDCEYLLVSGDLICIGSINATEVDIEGSLFYYSYPECDKLHVEGEKIKIERKSNEDEVFQFLNIEKNIYKDKTLLNKINNFKNDIVQDLIKRDKNRNIEDIFNMFTILSETFSEYKIYNCFIQAIMQLENKCKSINEYLYMMSLKSEIPLWILNLNCIKDKLVYIENIEIDKLKNDIENQYELVKLHSYLYKSKDLLKNDYDKLLNMLIRDNKLDSEYEILDNKSKSIEEVYDSYIEKGRNRSLVIGKIKNIESNKIIVTLEDNIDATLLDIYDIGDKSIYNVGDEISAYILKVIKKGTIEIDLYRNSKSYIHRSLNEMQIENIDKIKKSNIYIVNNSTVVIIIDSELYADFIEIERNIKRNLKVLAVKILNINDKKEENLSKLFNVNKSSIYNNKHKEYTIDVLDLEEYKVLNKKIDKAKEVIEALDISKVIINKLSIRNRYNIYTKKIGKLVRGTVIKKEDHKIFIGIEGNVKAIMNYTDANVIYKLGEEVIARVDSISLDETTIYLKVSNYYEKFILDLIDYTIKNLECEIDYEKLFNKNNKNGLDVELDIKDTILNKDQIKDIIEYINSKIDIVKDSITLKSNTATQVYTNQSTIESDDESISELLNIFNKNKETCDKSENIKSNNKTIVDTDISMSDLLNIFNKNKKICGVAEARVLKHFRIPGYKTLIISSKLALGKNKANLASLEYEMNMLLNNEEVKIIVYDSDMKVMISNILDINISQVDVEKTNRRINIKLEENNYNKIIENKEKETRIIQGLFPYYSVSFEKSNDEKNLDLDIINMLLK